MITGKKLQRMGFEASYWTPLEDGGQYRDWTLTVQPGVFLNVTEEDLPGKPIKMYPAIATEMGESIFLGLENTSQLIQLKELLSYVQQ